jgi:hypothetical protein
MSILIGIVTLLIGLAGGLAFSRRRPAASVTVLRKTVQMDMLDIPGRSIFKTISVGGEPHFIIAGPYPPASLPTQHQSVASSPNPTGILLVPAALSW